MRISDWSSDVCSSDLEQQGAAGGRDQEQQQRPCRRGGYGEGKHRIGQQGDPGDRQSAVPQDRKSVVQGKSVSVRVDLGGRRIIKKKNTIEPLNVTSNKRT